MALPKVGAIGFYDTLTVSALGFVDQDFSSSGSGGGGGGGGGTTAIKHGSTTITAVYHGSTEITKVYVGSTQVFP